MFELSSFLVHCHTREGFRIFKVGFIVWLSLIVKYEISIIDGSRPESGRVFGKSGSRADSGRLFFIFFFFSKVGPTRAESKKKFFLKKKSARVEKKTRPESARVSPSRAESARLGSRRPPHSKIFSKKKKTKKNIH